MQKKFQAILVFLVALFLSAVFQNCAKPSSKNSFQSSNSELPQYIGDETPGLNRDGNGDIGFIDDGQPLYSSARYAGTTQDEHAWSLNTTLDGGFISAGVRRPSPGANAGNDVLFQKWDSDGDLVYSVNIGDTYNNIGFRAIELLDSYLVVGSTATLLTGETNRRNDLLFLKLNKSNGTISQAIRIGGGNNESLSDVVVIDALTSNPQIWAVGTWQGANEPKALVISLDQSLNINWQRRYGTSGAGYGLNAVAYAPGRGVFAVGYTQTTGRPNSLIMKFNKSGLLLNSRSLSNNNSQDDYFEAIESSGNDLIAVGVKAGDGRGDEGLIVRFDWNLQVRNAFIVGRGGRSDSFSGVKITRDGGLMLSGTTESVTAGDPDNWLTKLAADNSIEFSVAFGTTSDDENAYQPLVVRPDGGYAMITNNFDSAIPINQGVHLDPRLLLIDQFGEIPSACIGTKGDVPGIQINPLSPIPFINLTLTPTDTSFTRDDTIFSDAADFVDMTPSRNQFCTN